MIDSEDQVQIIDFGYAEPIIRWSFSCKLCDKYKQDEQELFKSYQNTFVFASDDPNYEAAERVQGARRKFYSNRSRATTNTKFLHPLDIIFF